MKTTLPLFAASLFLSTLAAEPLTITMGWNGDLSIGDTGAKMTSVVHKKGWTGTLYPCRVTNDGEDSADNAYFYRSDDGVAFNAKIEAALRPDGVVTLNTALTALRDIETEGTPLSLTLPIDTFGGGSWLASNGSHGKFASKWDGSACHVFGKNVDYLELTTPSGQCFRLTVPGGAHMMIQDNRRWSVMTYSLRISPACDKSFSKGACARLKCEISSPRGIAFKRNKKLVVKASEDWIPLDYRKDIIPGSALDFSNMGLQDAPAGKYGWLKNENGHFAFEGLKGVPQRFCGVNLCFEACFPDRELANRLVTRLKRLGYNSVRIHHYDGKRGLFLKSDLKRGFNADQIARLDYLIAQCINAGLYVTTDLFTSRSVTWRELGIDRDGFVPMQVYKGLVAVHEPALRNWCEMARQLMTHVNPYTGRAYCDEPGLPLVSLVNEGCLNWCWNDLRKEEPTRRAWVAWLAKRRAADSSFAKGKVTDLLQVQPYRNDLFDRFAADVERDTFIRQSAFLRSLGVKAMLTNQNCGPRPKPMAQVGRDLYDYIDDHFYIDHPQFLGRSWSLPSRCDNRNPVKSSSLPFERILEARLAEKPFCVTEWNFSGPGMYRCCGGVLVGAVAARENWDGIWRFAYSHSEVGVRCDQGAPGYFDMASDALCQASDRANVCLFLRGDLETRKGARLDIDSKRGAYSLVSPRTCGGFVPSGKLAAGALSFDVGETASTVWVSSLDAQALGDARHLLLTHLTDVQADGNVYADVDKTIVLRWGASRSVARNGSADIALKIGNAQSCEVWSLETTGRRLESIPHRLNAGTLRFTASVKGAHGARLLYEIVLQ